MKTLAERTGLRFTKRRPRELPDPPYILAHCRAGWFMPYQCEDYSFECPMPRDELSMAVRRLRRRQGWPVQEGYWISYRDECFELVQDKYYSDGLIIEQGNDVFIDRWCARGKWSRTWI